MKVYIPEHLYRKLSPGMEVAGVVRSEENIAYILTTETSAAYSAIGKVFEDERDFGLESPRLCVYLEESGPDKSIWSRQPHLKADLDIVGAQDLYARTPFDPVCSEVLQNSRITVFGCGTGGSYIATELARAGVRRFTLVDPDIITPPNLSRHEGTFTDLGRKKVVVVKDRILSVSPSAEVSCHPEDVFLHNKQDRIEQLFRDSDLVIAATDRTAAQLLINEFCVNVQVPGLFGGCYENAAGGEVFAYVPEWKTPCLCCLKGSGVNPDRRRGPMDYSTASGPEDYTGQPGLHAAINLVSSVETQVALGILLRRATNTFEKIVGPSRCFWFIGGAFCEDISPFKKPFDTFHVEFQGPRRTCETCRTNEQPIDELEPFPIQMLSPEEIDHLIDDLRPCDAGLCGKEEET